MAPRTKIYLRSRVAFAVELHSSWTAQIWAPGAHAPRGLIQLLILMGLIAPAHSCSESISVINADLLPVCGGYWRHRVACAHRAVEVCTTRGTRHREVCRRPSWCEMSVEMVPILT